MLTESYLSLNPVVENSDVPRHYCIFRFQANLSHSMNCEIFTNLAGCSKPGYARENQWSKVLLRCDRRAYNDIINTLNLHPRRILEPESGESALHPLFFESFVFRQQVMYDHIPAGQG